MLQDEMNPLSKSENPTDVGYSIDEHTDRLLSALASVVVDELIRLTIMGKTPKEVEAMYTDRTMPIIPEGLKRRRRRRKEAA